MEGLHLSPLDSVFARVLQLQRELVQVRVAHILALSRCKKEADWDDMLGRGLRRGLRATAFSEVAPASRALLTTQPPPAADSGVSVDSFTTPSEGEGTAAIPELVTPETPPAELNPKVYARLSNAPKYAFQSDIISFFDNCHMRPEQLVTIYDEKYRTQYLQIEFDNMEAFRVAQRTLVRRGRLGGRFMKLEAGVKSEGDDNHGNDKDFRGRSILMMQLPTEVIAEDVERFFQGYRMSPFSTKFLTVTKDFFIKRPLANTIPPGPNTIPPVERRALVKFSSPLEALRALREKQGQFCLNRAIELRYIQ